MHKDTKPWTHNATLLLISLTKQMAEDFQSPVLKKVEVWKKVAAQMLAKGYDFGAEACDNKFRQLKHSRYKTIVDSKKKTGSGASSWVFFSSMEDLLANDPSVEPVLVVSSFPGSSSDSVTTGPSTSQPSSSQPKPSAQHGKKRRCKSEAPEWFEQYATEQKRQMSELMSLQKQALEVANKRNNILEYFVSALTKK